VAGFAMIANAFWTSAHKPGLTDPSVPQLSKI